MAEHAPLTKQERERLHTRIHANVERALAEYDDDDWADMCMRGLGYILRYEATVVALEAELARLRPLAEAVEKLSAADWEYVADLLRAEGFASYERAVKVCRAIAAALRAAKGEGDE